MTAKEQASSVAAMDRYSWEFRPFNSKVGVKPRQRSTSITILTGHKYRGRRKSLERLERNERFERIYPTVSATRKP
jgi:hypothetical protein